MSMPRTVCFRTKGQDFSRVNLNFDFCTFFIATQLSKSQLDQSPYVIRSFIVLKSAFHCLPTTVILRKTVFSTFLLVQRFYISLFSLLPFRDVAMKIMGGRGGQLCLLVQKGFFKDYLQLKTIKGEGGCTYALSNNDQRRVA